MFKGSIRKQKRDLLETLLMNKTKMKSKRTHMKLLSSKSWSRKGQAVLLKKTNKKNKEGLPRVAQDYRHFLLCKCKSFNIW